MVSHFGVNKLVQIEDDYCFVGQDWKGRPKVQIKQGACIFQLGSCLDNNFLPIFDIKCYFQGDKNGVIMKPNIRINIMTPLLNLKLPTKHLSGYI